MDTARGLDIAERAGPPWRLDLRAVDLRDPDHGWCVIERNARTPAAPQVRACGANHPIGGSPRRKARLSKAQPKVFRQPRPFVARCGVLMGLFTA